MILSRTESEEQEARNLAPFAARSAESLGRRQPENRQSRRMAYQRDRDRIVNAKSFRRLEYKTQVFVNGTADHYRTRLTHTFEVASVARTLARALRANEDLTDSIALGHDIGHSPFGHCGERALNALMAGHGGFDHNEQSLRWVELLEQEYPAFDGLNLSWEVRAGLRKHESRLPGQMLDGHPIGPFQMIEAQVADVADDITYHAHDTQDGLEAGLLDVSGLRSLELWQRAEERVHREHPKCPEDRLAHTVVRSLFTLQIEDALSVASTRLQEVKPRNPGEVMGATQRLLDFSPGMKAMLKPFRDYLSKNVYYHPSVMGANDESVALMTRLFHHYIEHPEHLGRKAARRIQRDGLHRAVCDYVAGCTDRYALEEVKRFGL